MDVKWAELIGSVEFHPTNIREYIYMWHNDDDMLSPVFGFQGYLSLSLEGTVSLAPVHWITLATGRNIN